MSFCRRDQNLLSRKPSTAPPPANLRVTSPLLKISAVLALAAGYITAESHNISCNNGSVVPPADFKSTVNVLTCSRCCGMGLVVDHDIQRRSSSA